MSAPEPTPGRPQQAGPGPAKGGDDGMETIAGLKTVLRVVEGVSPKDLKSLADDGKKPVPSGQQSLRLAGQHSL